MCSTQTNESTSVRREGTRSTNGTSLLSTLNLDAIPEEGLFKYPHPDKLYVPPGLLGMVKRIPVVDLGSRCVDLTQEADPHPDSAKSRTGRSISESSEEYTVSEVMHQPQVLESQESIRSRNAGEISALRLDIETDHVQERASRNRRTRKFFESSVYLEGPTPTPNETQGETFQCANCSEKVPSIIGLHEHYLLHALGNTRL